MRRALFLLASIAAPAVAQDTAPPGALTVGGGAAVVSDYRFRGVSQTSRRPAVQANATVTHRSGVYASAWASTVSDDVANGADAELDLIAGYSRTFASGVKVDGGVTWYVFPGGRGGNFVEPYLSVSATYGPVTGKVSASYAPSQRALGHDDSLYLAGDLSAGVPTTPLTLTAHLGRNLGPDRLLLTRGYTDWSLGAAAVFRRVTVGVSYVDTDRVVRRRGRNLSDAGVVASVGVSF